MLMKLEQSTDAVLGYVASGCLTDNDYKNFLIPQVNSAIDEYGRVRLLFQFDGFRGWEVKAAWDDLMYGLEINKKVEKIALVGEQDWEQWIARLVNVFTHAEARYFPQDKMDEAWEWINLEEDSVV